MKQVSRAQLSSFGLAGAAFAVAVALGGSHASAQVAPPGPPVPNQTPVNPNAPTSGPVISTTAIPAAAPSALLSPAPTPGGKRGRGRGRSGSASPAPAATSTATGRPEPTATPTSPAFATLDGTWEFQLQFADRTEYSYLDVKQSGTDTLTGTWRTAAAKYPFEGTYDGRLIRLLVKEPKGNVTMSGYVEGAQDMVGLVDLGTGQTMPTAFTAEHRAAPKALFKKS